MSANRLTRTSFCAARNFTPLNAHFTSFISGRPHQFMQSRLALTSIKVLSGVQGIVCDHAPL
jgi:hypothetical protein